MRPLVRSAIVVVASLVVGFAVVTPAASAEPAMNAFAIDLYKRIAEHDQGDNVFLSPASISIALSMTAAGARGATASEMTQTLGLDPDDAELHREMGRLISSLVSEREGSRLSIANALWAQEGFDLLEPFVTRTEESYGARVVNLDFRRATEEARRTINRWTEERTADRIRELLKPGMLDPLTRLVLTNAVYFKGTWQTRFEVSQTCEQPFRLVTGQSRPSIKTMQLWHQFFRYFGDDTLQILELPYTGEEVSMVVLLPAENRALRDLERDLDAKQLDEWLGRLIPQELNLVAIPRFTMTRGYSVSATLQAMGMRRAFDPETADFSGISADGPLFVSDVVHKAFVEVNEAGTEAAASTAVTITRSLAGPTKIFRADRPFLFLIRHRASGTILFLGRVTDPS